MPADLLVVTQTAPYLDGPAGVHGVLGQAEQALAQLADRHGLRGRVCRDVRELDRSAIERSAVLALFTIGETPWSAVQRASIMSAVNAGKLQVVAIHAATDSCYEWADYGALVGARFDGHPWTQPFVADVVDPSHPACEHLGDSWSWTDEVYQFRDLRPDARVLLRVRDGELDLSAPGAQPPEFGYPLAWCFEHGRGRVFSTSLGHFPQAWESPTYLRHLDGGLAWVLDDGD